MKRFVYIVLVVFALLEGTLLLSLVIIPEGALLGPPTSISPDAYLNATPEELDAMGEIVSRNIANQPGYSDNVLSDQEYEEHKRRRQPLERVDMPAVAIPTAAGVYLDAGFGWVKIQRGECLSVNLVADPIGFLPITEMANKRTIAFRGSQIRLVVRLGSDDVKIAKINFRFYSEVDFYPLSAVNTTSYREGQEHYLSYACWQKDRIERMSVDGSDCDAGYIYFEINDIPSNSTGIYALDWGPIGETCDDIVFLRRE